jgi:hypothetical protein
LQAIAAAAGGGDEAKVKVDFIIAAACTTAAAMDIHQPKIQKTRPETGQKGNCRALQALPVVSLLVTV